MGEPTKEDKQRKQDQADFASVDNVSDLEAHDTGGKHIQAQQQERIMPASANGYFEIEGGAREGLGAPLHVGAAIKHDAGQVVGQYEAAYNSYSLPLRSTLRSLGRVKDVALTGAPMTPEELMKRPELAARFSKLKPESNDASGKSFTQWRHQQTTLSSDVRKLNSGQHQLNGAIAGYRRVQQFLEQRRTEAKKAAKQQELHKIEESAEILAKIVESSVDAWGAIGEIEEGIEKKGAFDESAEGANPVDANIPRNNDTNYDFGSHHDRTGENKDTRSKTAKRGDALDEAGLAGKGVSGIVGMAKSKLQSGGTLSLSFKDLFIGLTDATGYKALQDSIKELDEKLKDLELDQAHSALQSATEQLQGTQLEFAAQRKDVQNDRVEARKQAQQFGKDVAGDKGAMAMYAAEAFAELSSFGALASQMRKDMVDPLWGPVRRYLEDISMQRVQVLDGVEDKHRIAREKHSGKAEAPATGPSALADAKTLATNIQAVGEQRTYFAQHLPQWQRTNQQWSEFLRQRTGDPLEVQATEADRRSSAP